MDSYAHPVLEMIDLRECRPKSSFNPASQTLAHWPPIGNAYDSPYPCLLIDNGIDKILVDTGAGNFGPNDRTASNKPRIGRTRRLRY